MVEFNMMWIFGDGLERENKMLRCPNCKRKTEHKPKGFEQYNRRWQCLNCNKDNTRYNEYE
jgi:transposase-like protein